MSVIRPATTPTPVPAREVHTWRCACGKTYQAGSDRPDAVVFGAWREAHRAHEEGMGR